MNVPDYLLSQTQGRRRHHQAGANAVRMNQIRIDADNFLPEVEDRARERFEVAHEMIGAPGKPRF